MELRLLISRFRDRRITLGYPFGSKVITRVLKCGRGRQKKSQRKGCGNICRVRGM